MHASAPRRDLGPRYVFRSFPLERTLCRVSADRIITWQKQTDATICRGSARTILIGSGCRKSCCSRRRLLRSSVLQRFVDRFPDVQALASAPIESVMASWSGLGYYSRARNLHRCAQQIMDAHGGEFPREVQQLAQLPGVGRSTAAAIAALAFGKRAAILDGNVRRVLARHCSIEGYPDQPADRASVWQQAESLFRPRDRGVPTRLMDLVQRFARAAVRIVEWPVIRHVCRSQPRTIHDCRTPRPVRERVCFERRQYW